MASFFPKKSLKDIFNQVIQPTGISIPQTGFSLRTATLPNGVGSYQTPVVTPQNQAPIKQPTVPTTPPAPQQPLFQQPTAPQPTSEAQIPQQWLKPDGGFYSPDEVAANIVKAAPQNPGGDIGRFSATQFLNPKMTSAQLESTATGLNNTRNDIASGETDPYGIASMSGIAYSPAELKAIENAYSGIFDPALNSALAKLNQKQQEEAQNNAPYTLGKDQVRVGPNGTIIASGSSTTTALPSVYTKGENPSADSWVERIQNGSAKITEIPASQANLRNLVSMGLTSYGNSLTGKPVTTEIGLQALDAAKRLKTMFDAGDGTSAVGTSRLFGGGLADMIPGGARADFVNLFNNLAANKSLEGSKFLKGQGQVSDAERLLLKQAMSDLNLSQSEEEFSNSLDRIINKLEGNVDSNTPVSKELTPEEISVLKAAGKTDQEIEDWKNNSSFDSVGNTKVSKNLPQRNNNPGNVKGGGLADSLAIGKDSQGHLIFPDANTGFQALTMDVTAKVNGGSRFLPRNPTIAQLGSVYAEDPAWAKSVARIIGVPVTAQTLDIPIEALTKAIATQEGFYA